MPKKKAERLRKWIDKKEKEDALKKLEEREEALEKEAENIYDAEQRGQQLAEDEITAAEAGFVEGYQDVKEGVCNTCGKEIDPESVVEKEVSGKILTFCCQRCADVFEKRKAGLR